MTDGVPGQGRNAEMRQHEHVGLGRHEAVSCGIFRRIER